MHRVSACPREQKRPVVDIAGARGVHHWLDGKCRHAIGAGRLDADGP